MKKKNQKTNILFAAVSLTLGIAFSIRAAAEEPANTSTITTQSAAATVAPKNWKAEISSLYYDFEGTKGSTGDFKYSFGNSTLNLQLMTLQYQYSPNWTLMVIGQYMDNFVETKMFGTIYQDRVKGMGDTFVSGMTPLVLSSSFLMFADVGLSLPTGGINEENHNNPGHHLAYNMQLGSGTTDAVLGLTPIYLNGPAQLGSHLTAILRNGTNSNGYRLGNLYRADAWADYKTSVGLTPRLVGYYKHKDAVTGEDTNYIARSQFSEFYYHPQINWDISAALKYDQTVGPVALSAEVGRPLLQDSQNIDGAVVSTEYYGNLKVSGSF